jgi:hypothetical protein
VCVYRATLLKQAQSVNLKLLSGEPSASAKDGCIYGIFNKAELWPGTSETEETAGQTGNKPEKAANQLSVESIKTDFTHVSKPSSGTVSFKWQTSGGVVRIIVKVTSATDEKAAVDQALSLLQDAAPALGAAIRIWKLEIGDSRLANERWCDVCCHNLNGRPFRDSRSLASDKCPNLTTRRALMLSRATTARANPLNATTSATGMAGWANARKRAG